MQTSVSNLKSVSDAYSKESVRVELEDVAVGRPLPAAAKGDGKAPPADDKAPADVGPAFSFRFLRRQPVYRAYLFTANLLVSIFGCWYMVTVIDRPWFTFFSPYCYSVWYTFALLACASNPQRRHTKWLIRNLVYHGAAWAVAAFALWPKSEGSSLIPVGVALAHMVHYSGVMSTIFIQGLPDHMSTEPPPGVHCLPRRSTGAARCAAGCCGMWTRCWSCYCTPAASLSRLSRHRLFFLLRATMARIDLFTDISFGLSLLGDSSKLLQAAGILLFVLCFVDYFAVDLSITAAKLTVRLVNFKFFSQVVTEVPVLVLTVIITFLRDGSQDEFVVGLTSCSITCVTLAVHIRTYILSKRRLIAGAITSSSSAPDYDYDYDEDDYDEDGKPVSSYVGDAGPNTIAEGMDLQQAIDVQQAAEDADAVAGVAAGDDDECDAGSAPV